MTDYLNKLNQEQKEAVTHGSGPLLIVAGAGTGKTTVLINRLVYLIEEKEVSPERILLLTFTEKAAGELTERADKALPLGYFDLWINTFHGFCDRVLKDHGLDIGLPTDYKLISQTEQWILIKKYFDKFNLDYYRPLGNPDKFISELIKHFSRLKDENISADEYLNYAQSLEADQDAMLSGAKGKKDKEAKYDAKGKLDADKIKELAGAYHTYNQLLLDNKFLDFGDLINQTIRLLKERPAVLKAYRQQFEYVMVDEFQDTNWAQYELIKMIAAPKNNLVAVGDDDQSIYKFRGASLSNIMQFKDDFPAAKEAVLIKNYRSGQEILDKAYEFIKHNNPNRLEERLQIDKKIVSQIDDAGFVRHYQFGREDEETAGVVAEIKDLVSSGRARWQDCAVLIRANNTADRFVREMERQAVPHQFLSLRGLYYKPIILDVLAYLRLLDNYHESSALFRVMGMAAFKVDPADVVSLSRFARRTHKSLFEAVKNYQAVGGLSATTQKNIDNLLHFVEKHSSQARDEKLSLMFIDFVRQVVERQLDRDRDVQKYDWLHQFYQKIKKFEEDNLDVGLREFMELINLEIEAGETGSLRLTYEDADTVKIVTVHSAKGLEFKYVFLVDLVDKRFPTTSRSEQVPLPDAMVKETLPEGDVHIEEERRLFYVAMTRAKNGLYLTGARDVGGAREKKPSAFITEAGVDEAINVKASPEQNDLIKEVDNYPRPEPQADRIPVPDKFSFSQIAAYQNCPLQYKFAHVLKIPVEDKPTAIFGRLMHNVLQTFLHPIAEANARQASMFDEEKSQAAAKQINFQRLKKIFDDKWSSLGYQSAEEAEAYRRKGYDMLKLFADNIESQGMPGVAFLEKSFNARFGPHIVKGTIDRIDKLPDGTYELMDYKTGQPKDKVYYQEKKQLLIYHLAWLQIMDQAPSKLTYYYLDDSSTQSFAAKDTDLEKVEDEVITTIENIKALNFEPTPGHQCKFCDFRNICPYRAG